MFVSFLHFRFLFTDVPLKRNYRITTKMTINSNSTPEQNRKRKDQRSQFKMANAKPSKRVCDIQSIISKNSNSFKVRRELCDIFYRQRRRLRLVNIMYLLLFTLLCLLPTTLAFCPHGCNCKEISVDCSNAGPRYCPNVLRSLHY